MKKKVALLLLLCAVVGLLPRPAAHAENYDPIVKIGLYYDSSALVAANLQNVTGTGRGYAFGYYDAQREFVSDYQVEDENQITVLKNVNLWLSGSTYSDVKLNSYDAVVGAYCLQVNQLFDDPDEALEVCEDFWNAGYDAYLCMVSGGYRVRIGTYTTADGAAGDAGAVGRVGYELVQRGPSGTCYTVVITGTDEILFQLDYLGEYPLGIQPLSEQTWFKGIKYYGGFEYYRPGGGDINVINVVGLTDYVKGVIPYEISPSWPVESQKAMALCAKSYALNSLRKHSSKGFDLCNGTDCQVYRGTNGATSVSDGAVQAVDGQFVVYDNQICVTYYHASSGGYTEDAGNIWGKDIPYLKAVEDIYLEKLLPYSNTITMDDVTWILQAKGYTNQKIKDVYVSRFSSVGNVLELTAVQADGKRLTFTGDRARTALNSPTRGVQVSSHRYTISGGGSTKDSVTVNGSAVELDSLYAIGGDEKVKSFDVTGAYVLTGKGLYSLDVTPGHQGNSDTIVISGTGSGHNIGLSQWGAYAMGARGFSCEEIIEFYYTGATVEYYDPN